MIFETDIELGQEYECVITGFRGIATAIAFYISGCDQVCLDPGMDKDGERGKTYYVDINTIRVPAKNVRTKVEIPDGIRSSRRPSTPAVNSPTDGPSRYEPPAR